MVVFSELQNFDLGSGLSGNTSTFLAWAGHGVCFIVASLRPLLQDRILLLVLQAVEGSVMTATIAIEASSGLSSIVRLVAKCLRRGNVSYLDLNRKSEH